MRSCRLFRWRNLCSWNSQMRGKTCIFSQPCWSKTVVSFPDISVYHICHKCRLECICVWKPQRKEKHSNVETLYRPTHCRCLLRTGPVCLSRTAFPSQKRLPVILRPTSRWICLVCWDGFIDENTFKYSLPFVWRCKDAIYATALWRLLFKICVSK